MRDSNANKVIARNQTSKREETGEKGIGNTEMRERQHHVVFSLIMQTGNDEASKAEALWARVSRYIL